MKFLNSDGLGVLNSIKLASSGLIYATVLSATSQDIDIHKSVYHASAGIAEAAEASVKLNLELIPQIKLHAGPQRMQLLHPLKLALMSKTP